MDSLDRIFAVRGEPKIIKTDNGSECLNAHWFLSLDDAKAKIGAWRADYSESRPHSALDWLTPAEFARRCWLQPATTMSKEPEVFTSERY